MSPAEFGDLMKSVGIVYLLGCVLVFICGSVLAYRNRRKWPGDRGYFNGTDLFLFIIGWPVLIPVYLMSAWVDFLNTRR